MSWTSSNPDLYGRAQDALRRSSDVTSIMINTMTNENAFYIKTIGVAVKTVKTGAGEERIDVYAMDGDMSDRAKEFIEGLLEEKLNDK